MFSRLRNFKDALPGAALLGTALPGGAPAATGVI
jgi:hypothetical protein